MIKSKKINDKKVVLSWKKDKEQKPLREAHSEIVDRLNVNFFLLGKKESGKTSTALFLIKSFSTPYSKLVVFTTTNILNSTDNRRFFKEYEKKFGKEHMSIYFDVYDENEVSNFSKEMNEAEERYKEYLEHEHKARFPTTIFLIDDMGNDLLRNSDQFATFLQNIKHYNSLVIICSQEVMNLSRKIRETIDIWLMFPNVSDDRLNEIRKVTHSPYDQKTFMQLYNYCTSEPLNFMYLDALGNAKEIRKNLDELLYIKKI